MTYYLGWSSKYPFPEAVTSYSPQQLRRLPPDSIRWWEFCIHDIKVLEKYTFADRAKIMSTIIGVNIYRNTCYISIKHFVFVCICRYLWIFLMYAMLVVYVGAEIPTKNGLQLLNVSQTSKPPPLCFSVNRLLLKCLTKINIDQQSTTLFDMSF